MNWTNVCIEGLCLAPTEDGKAPCGLTCTSDYCLGGSRRCPCFGWTRSSEREAAYFVPLRLIVWDRVGIWLTEGWWKARWLLWDQFNRGKVDAFLKNIPVAEEDPEFTKREAKAAEKFAAWLKERCQEDIDVASVR